MASPTRSRRSSSAATPRKAAPKRRSPARLAGRTSRKAARTASRAGANAKAPRPAAAAKTQRSAARAAQGARRSAAAPASPAGAPAFRFKPGDRVRTRTGTPKGHCRTPFYLRGQAGVIERCLGHFRNPEQLAYGKPGVPKQALYTVRFPQRTLWKGYSGAPTDTLVADLYEFWLEPA